MPDIALNVSGFDGERDAGGLERVLLQLECVDLVNVDAEKGLVAVSYSGGKKELGEIESALEEARFDFEPTPGAREVEE